MNEKIEALRKQADELRANNNGNVIERTLLALVDLALADAPAPKPEAPAQAS